jgi:hypothetical protein
VTDTLTAANGVGVAVGVEVIVAVGVWVLVDVGGRVLVTVGVWVIVAVGGTRVRVTVGEGVEEGRRVAVGVVVMVGGTGVGGTGVGGTGVGGTGVLAGGEVGALVGTLVLVGVRVKKTSGRVRVGVPG